ncbi:hypothetical protein TYRP_018708 [Tyrophagus putrescentiae]|nr:hypothetical protein TYRP_018708 [Tyrophagus putrescentiae]
MINSKMPPYRLQKVRAGGQQGELLSKGNRLYGGPFSRSQRQLAAVGADFRASSASAEDRHSLQRLLSQHLTTTLSNVIPILVWDA